MADILVAAAWLLNGMLIAFTCLFLLYGHMAAAGTFRHFKLGPVVVTWYIREPAYESQR